MNEIILNRVAAEAKFQFGSDIEEFMTPISDEKPCGNDLRSNGVYDAITEARKSDDPNLPRGVWTHDLKKSSWGTVSEIALDALKTKTKDLQIGFWLLEAQVHQHKFAGIAPSLLLLKTMCEQHWEQLHPTIVDGDLEYRTNTISWANNKLLPAFRLLEITENPKLDVQFSWADWELAVQHEQYREQKTKKKERVTEQVTTQEIINAITSTSTDFYQASFLALTDAMIICDAFEQLLEKLCNENSPSLFNIRSLLDDITNVVSNILEQRGVDLNQLLMTTSSNDDLNSQSPTGNEMDESDDGQSSDGSNNGSNNQTRKGIQNRSQAYSQLSEAAEYLMSIEPHSPVPYLVRRAIQWGNLNTSELYQELFVTFQGQLNIFEILGLDIQKQK